VTFTMQGETWLGENEFGRPADWLGTTWEQTPTTESELRAGFCAVADWGRTTGRPLFLAEFGTSNHADPPSRARWTRFNRLLAEEHGLPWGIWSFAPTFAIYDPQTGQFDPSLLKALMDLTPARPAPAASFPAAICPRSWSRSPCRSVEKAMRSRFQGVPSY
jgi:endoglucanase